MSKVDYFSNSIYLTSEEKSKLNSDLQIFFKYVKELFSKLESSSNLYLTGSLARKEPSCKIVDNKITLNSDIDFIVIVKKTYDPSILDSIIKNLKSVFSQYKSSFMLIYDDNIHLFKSLIGLDFYLYKDNPVYEGFSLPEMSSPNIVIDDYLEVVSYQFFSYYLSLDYCGNESLTALQRGSSYLKLKIILELLRFQSNKPLNCLHTFKNVYNNKLDKIGIDADVIEKVIHAREYSIEFDTNSFSYYEFILKTISYIFGITDLVSINSIENRLFKVLLTRIEKSDNFLTVFQCLLILVVLSIESPSEKSELFYSICCKSLTLIKNKDSLCSYIREFQNKLELTHSIDTYSYYIISILSYFKPQYMINLTLKNTGSFEFLDIKKELVK